ncbi:MAG: ribosome assembly RNA-binding protein YhbY [Polyangiaceae bacterium]|jgi:RNA-binding protein|nr:ribosome assembly RNA-binding protein YhbY [Polyangiaceae bacterium]
MQTPAVHPELHRFALDASLSGGKARAIRMNLTGKQRRHLRALGHSLVPVVHIGKAGLTDGLAGALDQALLDHELIKVRVLQEAPLDRQEAAEAMAGAAHAVVVQVLGRNVLLYRPHPEEPTIVLPDQRDEQTT